MLVDYLQEIRVLDHDGSHALTGDDGVPDRRELSDHLPVRFQLDNEPNRRYQVTVFVRPVPDAPGESAPGLGWPTGFFEQTAGSIQDETFFRHDQ